MKLLSVVYNTVTVSCFIQAFVQLVFGNTLIALVFAISACVLVAGLAMNQWYLGTDWSTPLDSCLICSRKLPITLPGEIIHLLRFFHRPLSKLSMWERLGIPTEPFPYATTEEWHQVSRYIRYLERKHSDKEAKVSIAPPSAYPKMDVKITLDARKVPENKR